MATLRSVKGMNDILPPESSRWHRVERCFSSVTQSYGFQEVRTPLVEPTALFQRAIGDATDIVEKEMYSFVDKGDASLTLRPEATAACVRAYVQHNVQSREPVSKWSYAGPMFRRERPAKGRYRQFYQLGAEVYGDQGPYIDAELIEMATSVLRQLGIQDIEVQLNSLGSASTRHRYREALRDYLQPQAAKLSEDSQRRLERNPLRILDSKSPDDQAITAQGPKIHEFIDASDRAHFDSLCTLLSKLNVKVTLNQGLVRGLDYYTRTLFEIQGHNANLGAQSALCGGGRYDTLIPSLGGSECPAVGFAMGVERLLLSLPETPLPSNLDVFMVVIGEEWLGEGMQLMQMLRAQGFRVDADLRGQSLRSQMRRADKSGARFALLLGDDEVAKAQVQLRDLQNKDTQHVRRDELLVYLRQSVDSQA